jgi:hypothetical protein
MAQCAGTTQKGERCKRDAREGSSYCSIHFAPQDEPQPEPAAAPRAEASSCDRDWTMKAALGVAAIVAIVLFRIRR